MNFQKICSFSFKNQLVAYIKNIRNRNQTQRKIMEGIKIIEIIKIIIKNFLHQGTRSYIDGWSRAGYRNFFKKYFQISKK